jgi:hypothetical protein
LYVLCLTLYQYMREEEEEKNRFRVNELIVNCGKNSMMFNEHIYLYKKALSK